MTARLSAPTTHPYHSQVAPPDRALSEPDTKSLRSNWESETRMAGVYEALAGVASDAGVKRRLKTLAETEKRHADAWAELLTTGGVKLPERRPRLTAQMLAALARIAGIGPALALAGAAEGQVLRSYLGQVSTVSDQRAQGVLRKVLPEELDHQSSEDIAGEGRSEPESAGKNANDAFDLEVEEIEEWHGGGVESIRNVIYGVNDGLTATLGVLAGVGGASANSRVVLIGGLSAMVASGVSMAGGAYLASKSQREVFEGQLAREAAEIEAMPELERAELVKIYRSKGLTPEEAKTIVGRITADKKVWLETQAREELGLDVAQFENPVREGVVAGISTLIGGAIPVIGFLAGRWLLGATLSGLGALIIAFALSAAFLFLIGSARSFFTGKGGVRSGLEMLAVGTAVAALTYVVGVLFRV
ncbi:MAG: vacuolar iron transporter family protein [Chloroflexota bacterium]|jgi:VIT1/CCC1 family predicted Fe2+/Mn2+ transporter/rubrerythrin|nr:vacuolar iron transporter family protein [Chloroflexota bacterium]